MLTTSLLNQTGAHVSVSLHKYEEDNIEKNKDETDVKKSEVFKEILKNSATNLLGENKSLDEEEMNVVTQIDQAIINLLVKRENILSWNKVE